MSWTFTWSANQYPWASPGTCREIGTWEPVPAAYPVKLHIWDQDAGNVDGTEPVTLNNRAADWVYVIAAQAPGTYIPVERTATVAVSAESGLLGSVVSAAVGGAYTGTTNVFASGDGVSGLGRVCLTRTWSATVRNTRSSVWMYWNGGIAENLAQYKVERHPGKVRGTFIETLTQVQPSCSGAPDSGSQWADWREVMTVAPYMSILESVSYKSSVTVYDRQGQLLGHLPAMQSTTKPSEAKLKLSRSSTNYVVSWWE
jgi:hypothetical protein